MLHCTPEVHVATNGISCTNGVLTLLAGAQRAGMQATRTPSPLYNLVGHCNTQRGIPPFSRNKSKLAYHILLQPNDRIQASTGITSKWLVAQAFGHRRDLWGVYPPTVVVPPLRSQGLRQVPAVPKPVAALIAEACHGRRACDWIIKPAGAFRGNTSAARAAAATKGRRQDAWGGRGIVIARRRGEYGRPDAPVGAGSGRSRAQDLWWQANELAAEYDATVLLQRIVPETGPHMVHSHTVHLDLPLGALRIWCTVCGTGARPLPLPHLPHRCPTSTVCLRPTAAGASVTTCASTLRCSPTEADRPRCCGRRRTWLRWASSVWPAPMPMPAAGPR